MSEVGRRVRPLDWQARTNGTSLYTADIAAQWTALDERPILHAAVLRSPHPHARIEWLDTSAAECHPGVQAVITAADFPPGLLYEHRGGPLSDRPALAEGVVRFVGQEVAAVAAVTMEAAKRAVARITVRYRPLPAPMNIDDALAPSAPTLHQRTTTEPNVSVLWEAELGRPAEGWQASTVRSSGTYWHPSVNHAVMEPNTTLAWWHRDTECLELWTSTQSPYFVGKEVARMLGLEADQVVFREVAVGGGFGAKSKVGEHEVLAGALSRKTGMPVLITLSREEEFSATKPRHAARSRVRIGADPGGLIRFMGGDIDYENGAFNHMGSSVMRYGMITTFGSMYRPDGVSFRSRLVDTATQPGGSFRGYGTPQVAFALESEVDEVALKLGIDPLEVRLRNVNQPDSVTLSGSKVTSARLAECLEAVRRELDWDRRKSERKPGRGLGVAVATHGSGAFAYVGANQSSAAVDLFADGRVRVRFGGADPGTGQRTILAQIAGEELGVAAEHIEVQSMDSEETPVDQGAWSSRGTSMAGSAVAKAAATASQRLRELAAAKLGGDSDHFRLEGGAVVGDTGTVRIADLVPLADEADGDRLPIEATFVLEGTEMLNPAEDLVNLSPNYVFAAHGAEVEVSARTGKVRLVDYVAAHDVGRAINPTLVEGQIVGGAVMGIGAALGEEIIREGGRVVNNSYLNYAMPRSGDLPPIRPVLVEGPEPRGPYGAKSVGEIPIIPPAPAIANAVRDAIGVRIRELPITPDKVLNALAERDGRVRSHGIWRRPDRWWVAIVRWLYPRGLHSVLHRWGTSLARRRPDRPVRELLLPTSVAEAISLLRPRNGVARVTERMIGAIRAVPVAGNTDLGLQRRQGLVSPVRLVSLSQIAELEEIRSLGDGSLFIGAGVTLADLERRVGDRVPILAEAVRTIASPQIRAVATVGGNLAQAKRCWFFRNGFECYKRGGPTCPCYAVLGDHRFFHAVIDAHRCQAVTPSDLANVLVALDARVHLRGDDGERIAPLCELLTGPGELDLRPGEVITGVALPAPSLTARGVYEKLSLWDGDFAIASVAIVLHGGPVTRTRARVVCGAVAPVPWRATEAEAALLRGVDGAEWRQVLDRELDRHAHPLPRNGWKLDALAGLAETALERLTVRS